MAGLEGGSAEWQVPLQSGHESSPPASCVLRDEVVIIEGTT
jgi:hypothetical protein